MSATQESLLERLKTDAPLDDEHMDLYRREIIRFGGAPYVSYILRYHEKDRQNRVRDSLRSHGPWGGER
jgi:hypothetical protein